jgi:hypothetical protein
MSAQLTGQRTAPRSAMITSRATLRTRPRIQRTLIRSWEYIPAVRVTVLILRLLAVLVLLVTGIALLSSSSSWGLLPLAAAFAVVPFALWVFTTAAKGWPERC